MRTLLGASTGLAIVLGALSASANVISVSPADGTTAYKKIESAGPGDEVVIAPGTYAFRVYLTAQGTASQPIHIHAADPTNPPVWDPGTTLVEDLPGSYGGGDNGRGCWQLSGASNYVIEDIVFRNCRNSDDDSAGIRYYEGTTGLVIRNVLFETNDNGLTGGTQSSEATVEFCEFSKNGNVDASAPTHNAYIYGGAFTMRYSYLHDPVQGQNLHCRAVDSTIEYNWFDRAKSYAGDLMTSDDYANDPMGSFAQKMTLRGNVIVQGDTQDNNGQIWALYNDAASGSPVSFSITAINNTFVGAGGHPAFVHLSNADGTTMSATLWNNVISGTTQPVLVEDTTHATVVGTNNWIENGAAAAGLAKSVTSAAPGFKDPTSYDFTLDASSACVGASDTSVSGLPSDEYYENEVVTREYRVRASAKDLGAFEHDTMGPGIGPDGSAGAGGGTTASSSSGSSSGGGAGGATGAGGTSGAGATGSSTSTSSGGPATPGEPRGCSCSSAGKSSGALFFPMAGLALAWALARRRREARASVD